MRNLMPIILFSMVMAFCSELKSVKSLNEWGAKRYIRKDVMFFFIMTLAMAIFVGLRTRGNDTYTYRQMFEKLPADASAYANITWTKLASSPGLQLVSGFLRSIGATTQDYFMVFALITVIPYMWFIHKYTDDIWLSVYFFITMGVYTFTMAAIKQTFAVALLLIATDRAINKKYLRFTFWVLIAELFHPYAFVYLIIPFLFFKPWTRTTWLLIGGTVVVSMALSSLMSSIFAMTDMLGADYEAGAFIGEGVNVFRVAVVWVPVILSFIGRRIIQKETDRVTNLIINATMINAMIMFIALFGTANYFARLANYFLIFQTISLPWILRIFEKRSRQLVTIAAVICFFAYFYYANVMANGTFDTVYSFISFSDYLKQLF